MSRKETMKMRGELFCSAGLKGIVVSIIPALIAVWQSNSVRQVQFFTTAGVIALLSFSLMCLGVIEMDESEKMR